MRIFILILGVGCSKGGKEQGPVSGTITPDGRDTSGQVEIMGAFAYAHGGGLIAYLSSNPDTTCETAADYLDTDNSDPAGVLEPGACNLYLRVGSGYQGQLSATDDPIAAASMAMSCAMGTGEFVYEERDTGDLGWYWSGDWWQGYPTTFNWEFSGEEGGDLRMEMDMSEYSGGFIYESQERVPASGAVAGVSYASWCTDLAPALGL